MANVEINDLTAKTTPDETDELEIQETSGGLSKKITRANFIPDSSATVKGKVELATDAEALTGTDTARATTPANVKAVADTKANTSHTHAAADVTSGLLANGRIATGTPDGSKYLRDDQSWQAIPGGGDALTSNPLSQFASTTSLQLKGVLSDETGSGAAVFANSPALITPTGVVKGDVGLGNLDNTSDANKPVSTAQQTALDAKLDDSQLDTDGTLTANSDAKVASQKATKTYVDTAVTGLLDFKGSTDASANPNYPAASKGDAYVISVAGKVGGASGKSVDIGDVYLATADNAGGTEASVGTSWIVLEHNLVGAYTVGGTDVAIADGGTGASTATAGFDALSPMTTAGDLIYGGASGTRTRLGIGTGLQVLRTNAGATAPEWAAASGGGQTTYDAIVAASGGTHTTLASALTAASNGWRILVLDGETLSGNVSSALTNLEIVGAGRKGTLIVLGANILTFSGAGCTIRGLGFTATTGNLTCSGAGTMLKDCYFNWTSNSTTRAKLTLGAEGVTITDSEFVTAGTSSAGSPHIEVTGILVVVSNNYFNITSLDGSSISYAFIKSNLSNVTVANNVFKLTTPVAGAYLMGMAGPYLHCTGNRFYTTSANDVYFCSSSGADSIISDNMIYTRGPAILLAGERQVVSGNNIFIDGAASIVGVQCTTSSGQCIVSNNLFQNENAAAGTAISIDDGDDHVVSGNRVNNFLIGVTVTSSVCERSVITGNSFHNSTTPIVDSGTSTIIDNNSGMSAILNKNAIYMKNTSGGTINAGDVVTFKAVAAGNEVTTTTTASDNLVFGVATAAISSTASGYIQVAGKTTLLKVNGTTDIAVGDFLTTYTVAGIAKKAAPASLGVTLGDLAFAIALEAYTTDDSSGVIDALIISPRRL